ncbi:transcription elongation factor GreA [Candidatus Peribacteria bacterium RIFCSPHIGHO2_02_FULL_49_16]|nr:MAG: transcription elongation factor GreA [Candidatus Peribacteria bacterium RIFCSPHIGHO2_01_FULL_49_38]OGJ59219.1 MAG: transcription elongation factor GreA [Candidatus Peribacteria bacterium RIFCSPHIGHO2_02_FULL_49_16]
MDFDDQDDGSGSFGDQTLVTREGLKNLKEELEDLKNIRRKEVAQRLKEAISYGDLSENAEYEEAKNEQAFVEGRILELEHKIKNAKIITEKSATHQMEINVGSTVTVRMLGGDKDNLSFTIVGATEADPFQQKVSNESPIGKALLTKNEGAVIDVNTPGGKVKYVVEKVM